MGDASASASSKIRSLSGSAMSFGTILAGAGAIGVGFFVKSVQAANEYTQSAALALTQTASLGITLDQLRQVGIDTATQIPMAMDQMQSGLYDIFSSIKTDLPGATKLLEQFSRAGVAGQTDLQTVSRGTLQELNAFGLPVSKVNNLLDTQFQMVKLGVGTYKDFMNHLGNLVPASVAAGQSVNTMSGAWAFATRNGMNATLSATSLARAMEELQKPKFQDGLKKIGVNAFDSHGKLRQINDIVTDVAKNPAWEAQVKKSGSIEAAFTSLFGTGTIQARRFFNIAIPNYKQMNDVVDQMNSSKGATAAAYDIMFKQPISQIQLLKNNWQALQIMMGDSVAPALVKVVNGITTIIQAFNNLSPHTKQVIGTVGLLLSVFLLVFGAVTAVVGVVGLAVSAIMEFGFGIGAAIGILGGFAAALILIPVALYLIIKYHKDLVQWAKDAWHFIQDAVMGVMHWFQSLSGWVKVAVSVLFMLFAPFDMIIKLVILIIAYHHQIATVATAVWGAIWGFLKAVGNAFMDLVHIIMKPVMGAIKWFKDTWDAMSSWWKAHWDSIKTVVVVAAAIIFGPLILLARFLGPVLLGALRALGAVFRFVWDIFVDVVTIAWHMLKDIVLDTLGIIWNTFKGFLSVIVSIFKIAWAAIVMIFKVAWYIISGVVRVAISAIMGVISVFLDIVTGKWGQAWNDMKHFLGQTLDAIWGMITGIFGAVTDFLGSLISNIWNIVFQIGKAIVDGLWKGINAIWHLFWDFIKGIPGLFVDIFAGAWNMMWEIGKHIIEGLWEGLKGAWHLVSDGISNLLGGLFNSVTSFLGISSPSKKYHAIGQHIAAGLAAGIKAGTPDVLKAQDNLFALSTVASNPISPNSILAGAVAGGKGSVNIVMPPGTISITINGTMSTSDQKALADQFDKSMQKFSTTLSAKIASTKAA